MAAYTTRWFERWAKKQGVSRVSLLKAIQEINAGLVDADLGGGLVKKRVARQGQGKSGGYRTILATNKRDRFFFLFGFAKNERDNIDSREDDALRHLAVHLLSLTAAGLRNAENAGEIERIDDDA